MKPVFVLILAASSCAFGQGVAGTMVYQTQGGEHVGWSYDQTSRAPVKNAPYSATITIQSRRTLPDGNHIVQKFTGSIARDSEGRTRTEPPQPAWAADAPHLLFVEDPPARTAYTLNLADKTAKKMPILSTGGVIPAVGEPITFSAQEVGGAAAVAGPVLATPMASPATQASDNQNVSEEELGSQTMAGLLVDGVRTARVIPAGQVGNEEPITVVTEVWTSPDLQTVVLTKRIDPRVGVETFRLTNITRTEPDPSLFVIPPGFKIVDGPQAILHRPSQQE